MSPDLEQRLRAAGVALAGPDPPATARARDAAVRAALSRTAAGRRRAAAVGGLLLATVTIGVVLGSLTVPGRSAASEPAGLGFLPAEGWVVHQSASPMASDRPGVAMAANVPLGPQDAADGFPYSTLQALPETGIVLIASFFRLRSAHGSSTRLPLQLSAAEPTIRWGGEVRPARPLGQYELRAVVDGYAVEVQAYFGTREPSPALLAEAQRQLDRLVVSPGGEGQGQAPRAPARAEAVTLAFQRYWYPAGNYYTFRFFGTISSGQAGEYVSVLKKECGASYSTAIAGALTQPGGAWEAVPDHQPVGGEFRARWREELSEPVVYRPPITVWLEKVGPATFRATVSTYTPPGGKAQSMKGRRIELQRLSAGRWVRMRTAKLALQTSDAFERVWTATFPVPTKGLRLRVYVPGQSARPCFSAGASRPIRS